MISTEEQKSDEKANAKAPNLEEILSINETHDLRIPRGAMKNNLVNHSQDLT